MVNCPCKNCELRSETCHIEGNCASYTEWKKHKDSEKLNTYKEKETQVHLRDFTIMCRNIAMNAKRCKR